MPIMTSLQPLSPPLIWSDLIESVTDLFICLFIVNVSGLPHHFHLYYILYFTGESRFFFFFCSILYFFHIVFVTWPLFSCVRYVWRKLSLVFILNCLCIHKNIHFIVKIFVLFYFYEYSLIILIKVS